jgi:hypothetical protein
VSAAPVAAATLRWQMPQVPSHWQVVPGWGLRGIAANAAGSNICLTEDTLLAGNQLEPYVWVQMDIMRRQFADPQFAGPAPTGLLAGAGVGQAALLVIRHGPLHGNEVVQLQVYGLLGSWIGIATLTALKQNVGLVRKDFELFLAALRVSPAPAADLIK